MIISHKHKFIFIAIPKTGTHAIRNALVDHLGKDDWEQVDLFRKSRLPLSAFQNLEHGHITAAEIKQHLHPKIWESYFKFSFVRNPFDRFISYAFFKKGREPLFQKHPLEFMKLMFKNPKTLNDLLFKPQITFISDNQNKIALDHVGRFESLQDSLDLICKEIGIPSEKLELVNASSHKDYNLYYDDELVQLVSEYYEDDLKTLGYGFPI